MLIINQLINTFISIRFENSSSHDRESVLVLPTRVILKSHSYFSYFLPLITLIFNKDEKIFIFCRLQYKKGEFSPKESIFQNYFS